MTLKECYQILTVDQSATLEDVKRAYRRRAFELHPDLNPTVSDASRQFQKLNEAYVILTKLIAARGTAEQGAAKSAADRQARQEPGHGAQQHSGSRWYDWGFSFGGDKKTEEPESAKTRPENSEERRAQREEAYREELRREEARQREKRREEERRRDAERREEERRLKEAEERRKAHERVAQERRERAAADHQPPLRPGKAQTDPVHAEQDGRREQPKQTDQTTHRPQEENEQTAHAEKRPGSPGPNDNLYAEQQEVLRDILNDDFARRVFEDIYSEIRKKGPQPTCECPPTSGQAASGKQDHRQQEKKVESVHAESAAPKSKGGFSFGLDQFRLDFSSGVGNTVKGWLRSQIDEEQTIRLPASGLYPGARVRLQIRRGLSDELTTLEVTLPPDFLVGRPIRLRGMGKKLGSLQGDLYLTVLAR